MRVIATLLVLAMCLLATNAQMSEEQYQTAFTVW